MARAVIVPLANPEDFARLVQSRPVRSGGPFALHGAELTESAERGEPIGLGFILPKRLVRSASQRNQIRRWTRGWIRSLPTSYQGGSWLLRVRSVCPWQGAVHRQSCRDHLRAVLFGE